MLLQKNKKTLKDIKNQKFYQDLFVDRILINY